MTKGAFSGARWVIKRQAKYETEKERLPSPPRNHDYTYSYFLWSTKYEPS
ncbi:hypothetical protein ACSS6W_007490 [Trichoderma asperelloides]